MSFVNVEYGCAECVAALRTLVVARHKDDADKGGLRLENPISRDAKHLAAVSRVSRGLRSTQPCTLLCQDGRRHGFSFKRVLVSTTPPNPTPFLPNFAVRSRGRRLSSAFSTVFLVNEHRNWFGDVSQRRLVSPANCLTFSKNFSLRSRGDSR